MESDELVRAEPFLVAKIGDEESICDRSNRIYQIIAKLSAFAIVSSQS